MAVFQPEENCLKKKQEDFDYVGAEGCRLPPRLAPAGRRLEGGGKNLGFLNAMDECPAVEELIDVLRQRKIQGRQLQ